MADTELNDDIVEAGQEWSSDNSAAPAPALTPPITPQSKPPLNFSEVTPCQLGISTQSFIPSSQGKDKSRLSQLKVKRRSTVGARGSPETNSLIRYIAQQRLKTPTGTPQPLQGSHLFRHGASTLKQKMASFQNLLELEEDSNPAEREETDRSTPAFGKENAGPWGRLLPATPPSFKRPHTGPLGENGEETTPLRTCGHPEQRQEQIHPQIAHAKGLAPSVQGPSPKQMEERLVESGKRPKVSELFRCETEEPECWPLFWSRSITRNPLPFTPTRCTLTKEQQTWATAPGSPSQPLPLDPADFGAPQFLPFPLLSPLATHPAAADEAEHAGNSVQCKKRVHFGVPLSPEFFDKGLPPSTPLQKGGMPAPPPASAGSLLRSLLKTPQRPIPALPQPDFNSPSPTKRPDPTLPQPDFSSPSLTEDSPPLCTGFHAMEARPSCQEEEGKMPVPVLITAPEVAKEACSSQQDTDVAPGVCEETARRESHQADTSPASPLSPSREAQTDLEQDPAPEPPFSTAGLAAPGPPVSTVCPAPESPVRTAGPAPESPVSTAGPALESPVSTAGPAQPRGRKRKQPKENDTTAARRRPSRNAAVSASGKMKGSAGKRRWGSKEVDRSLYGKRDYASKNPTLSPITETLFSTSQRRRSACQLPEEDWREMHNPSMPLREEPSHADPVASVVTAAALWRRRFLLPALEPTVNGHPDDHEDSPADVTASASASTVSLADRTADCAAGAGLTASPPSLCGLQPPVCEGERVGRKGRPRRSGRVKARKNSTAHTSASEREVKMGNGCTAQNTEEQTDTRTEPPTHSPTSHIDPPGNRQEIDGDSPSVHTDMQTHTQTDTRPSQSERAALMDSDAGGEAESQVDTDAHSSARSGAGDIGVPEPDAQPDAGREATTTAGQRSKPGRRSGALGRKKGRRSALLCPRSITEERLTQSPPAAEQSAGPEGGGGGEGEGGGLSGRWTERVDAVMEGDKERETCAVEQAPPNWQQVEFCIEDVLQPLPRGRRSVRRSLRNQSHHDPSASGLAWVPHLSPSASPRKSTRRGTRGRLNSVHNPAQSCPQSSPTPPTSYPSSTHDLPTLLEAPLLGGLRGPHPLTGNEHGSSF